MAVLALGVVAGVMKPVPSCRCSSNGRPDVLVLDTGETLKGAVLDQAFRFEDGVRGVKTGKELDCFHGFRRRPARLADARYGQQ